MARDACGAGAVRASRRAASAQTLDCSVVPQSICEGEDILVLEGERSALMQQLAELDPARGVGERTGLARSPRRMRRGRDCYRSAYLAQSDAARERRRARGRGNGALEEPPDAAAIGPPTEAEDAAPARRAARVDEGPAYVPRRPARLGLLHHNRRDAADLVLAVAHAGAQSRRIT